MRIGIAMRFGVMLALTGVLASGLTGYYAYHASRKMLVQTAEAELLTATRVVGRRIAIALAIGARNAQLLANYPETLTIVEAGEGARPAEEDRFAALIARMTEAYPELFQLRLIAAADHGRERVRIDRNADRVLRIPRAELQEKGHYDYVYETLQLPRSGVYIGPATINHEHDIHAGQDKPSLQIASPVYGNGEQALGVVVITVDVSGLFKSLSADLPPNFQLYMANEKGDFLIHPDPELSFALDRGRHALVQEHFPATAALIDGQASDVVASMHPQNGEPLVASFIKQAKLRTPGEQRFFILGLGQPLRSVLAASDELGATTLKIVVAFSALALVLTLVLMRALSRPLRQMVHAVERFAQDHTVEPLPEQRQDEIGILARSFRSMQHEITAQVLALRESQRELDYLASHDSLTGLPNRRLFYDRLEQAIARARRNEEPMALLFIDLDHFKEINDSYSHAVGDIVLREAAKRIRLAMREIDTVARLGGDEFVVLLDSAVNTDDIANVAQKILDALAPPIPYNSHAFEIGASIGISLYPQNGTTSTDLIGAADHAMYQSKENGRNRYCFAESNPIAN